MTSCADNLCNKTLDKLYCIKGYPDKNWNLISSWELNILLLFSLLLSLSISSSKFNKFEPFSPKLIVFLEI